MKFFKDWVMILLSGSVAVAEKFSEIENRKIPLSEAAKSINSFQLSESKYKQQQSMPLKIGLVENTEKDRLETAPDLLVSGLRDNITYKGTITIQLLCSDKDSFFPTYGRNKKIEWYLEQADGQKKTGNSSSDNNGFVKLQITSKAPIAEIKIIINVSEQKFRIDSSAGPYELLLSKKNCHKKLIK